MHFQKKNKEGYYMLTEEQYLMERGFGISFVWDLCLKDSSKSIDTLVNFTLLFLCTMPYCQYVFFFS